MTVDIMIGRATQRSFDEVLREYVADGEPLTHNNHLSVGEFIAVEPCPPGDDGCTKDDTLYPGESYRSLATLAMSDFADAVMPRLYREMKPVPTNDRQLTFIQPFLERINKLEYDGIEPMHKNRLRWFKFWCNRAVELFGEEAVIEWM